MALSRMTKIQIVGHNSAREEVVAELQRLGLVEITDLRETFTAEAPQGSADSQAVPLGKDSEYEEFLLKGEDRDEQLEKKQLEIEHALSYLSQFEKRSLGESFFPAKVNLSKEEFLHIIHNFDYAQILKACQELERDLKELEAKAVKLARQANDLLPYEGLNIPLEELKETRETKVTLGTVPNRNLDPQGMRERMDEVTKGVTIQVIQETKSVKYCLLIYLKYYQEEISNILREFEFTSVNFPGLRGKPKDILKDIKSRLQKAEEEKDILIAKSQEMLKERAKLMAVHDHLANLRGRKDIQNLFARTEETFLMAGWIKRNHLENLKKSLERKFPEIDISPIKPEKGERPPVELENRRLVRPFEMVTNLYGLPHSRELDPTPFLAPFFFLFFGLCVSDAGYGLILLALTLLGMKKMKVGGELFRLLALGGVATFICGALMGGWFGIDVAKVPSAPRFLKSVVLFNPLEQPMTFFKLALALGFGQICFGTVIKLIKDVREKKWSDALFSEGSWLLIFAGILVLVLGEGLIGPGAKTLGKWLVISGSLSRVILRGLFRERKLAGIGLGLILLLDGLKNLLGNVLSYSRLMALGMATGVIAMTVNLVAGLARDTIPLFGWLAMIMVLIGGHIFNIAINTLGSFVHTTRLQFVEFFPYFFEGGGKAFEPFRTKNEFTLIQG